MGLFIGLMSGTSADAVDAALVDIAPEYPVRLLACHHEPLPRNLRRAILSLFANEPLRPKMLGELDTRLGRIFAKTARKAISLAGVPPRSIVAIGSHGQTVHHSPDGRFPFTLQLGDANIIAEMTGVTTVADFRRRDMAAGGQGAPLVPAFHAYALGDHKETRVVLNLGGIANITVLPRHGNNHRGIIGFDTGPGNGLLDCWADREIGKPMDEHGQWSRSGSLDRTLLDDLLRDRYFDRLPPKSTGRESFGIDWLLSKLPDVPSRISAADVACTLCELSAATIAQAIRRTADDVAVVFVCGGGVNNTYLMERLAALLEPIPVTSTASAGLPPEWVECMAFAWLAHRTIAGLSGNIPTVTGARREVVLGSIHSARLSRTRSMH